MSGKYKVSVLMSVYYKEEAVYLDACLESILHQTYPPEEVLVVKDGTLTESLEMILNKWIKKYPEVFSIISLDKNVGLGKALAIGVNSCRNEWIARMDTDDIARIDRLEKQINYLHSHPEVSLIGSDIIEFEDHIENIIAKRNVPHSHEEISSFAKRRNPFNHMTVLYKKSAVISAGNYQPLNGYEDYYLWVRMLKNGIQTYNISEPLVFARGGEDMYERRGGWKYFKDGLKAQKAIYSIGLASPWDLAVRIFGQTLINLVPNKIRGILYKRVLRNEEKS